MLTVICFRYFIWFGDVESWKQLRFEDDEEVEVLLSEDFKPRPVHCSKCLLKDRENMLFLHLFSSDDIYRSSIHNNPVSINPPVIRNYRRESGPPGEEGGLHHSSQHPG